MENGALLVKGKAGLGNRLLSVLGAILYGSIVGRDVCVDWSDGTYAAKGVDAFATAFQFRNADRESSGASNRLSTFSGTAVSLGEIQHEHDVHPTIWKGNLDRSIEDLIQTYDPDAWNDELSVAHKYSMDFRQPDPGHSVCVRWSYHDDVWDFFPQLGWATFSEHARFELLRETFHNSISLTNSILDHVDQATSPWSTEPLIGIHVRYTDNQSPLPQLLRRLDQQATQSPSANIFLATDNLEIERQIQGLYPDRVLTSVKSLPTDGTPLHHQHRGTAAMIESMVDLVLLSRCRSLIYSSRSTFGYCAALFSQADPDHRFDCLTHAQKAKRIAKTVRYNLMARRWRHAQPSHAKTSHAQTSRVN